VRSDYGTITSTSGLFRAPRRISLPPTRGRCRHQNRRV